MVSIIEIFMEGPYFNLHLKVQDPLVAVEEEFSVGIANYFD